MYPTGVHRHPWIGGSLHLSCPLWGGFIGKWINCNQITCMTITCNGLVIQLLGELSLVGRRSSSILKSWPQIFCLGSSLFAYQCDFLCYSMDTCVTSQILRPLMGWDSWHCWDSWGLFTSWIIWQGYWRCIHSYCDTTTVSPYSMVPRDHWWAISWPCTTLWVCIQPPLFQSCTVWWENVVVLWQDSEGLIPPP